MKYIALEELQKYIIHDGCDEGCGYIDERDIAAISTVDLDKIRAEIEFEVDHRNNMLCAEDVFAILNKYKEESEGE